MDSPGPAGHLFIKSHDVDVTSLYGYDIPLAGGRYAFATFASGEYTYPGICVADGLTSPSDFYYPVIWVSHLDPNVERSDYEDPEVRGLVQGRMQGSYSATDGYRDLTVSWMLCREGDACPPPPELPPVPVPPPAADPCARAGQQAALRDTCHAQLDLLLDGLAPALAEYNSEMKLAEANRAEFERAQKFCELYDKAKEVLEAIISGGTGPAAEAARALVYLRDVIEKVQEGDLASMLYPEQMATFLGYYAKAKAIWFEVTASEIDKMQRDLDGCSGKVPIDTYMAAKKFLEHFKAAKRVWDSKVAPGLNDLRTKGLECAGLDHAAWRACFADAECRGVPPACGPEPSLEGAYD